MASSMHLYTTGCRYQDQRNGDYTILYIQYVLYVLYVDSIVTY